MYYHMTDVSLMHGPYSVHVIQWCMASTLFLFNLAKRHRLNFCRDYSRAFHIFLISRKSSFDTTKSAPKRPDESPRRQATIQNTTQLGLQWLKQHNPRPCFFPSISFILDLLSNHYKIMVLILKIISFRNNFNFSLKTFLHAFSHWQN
jgi:hypothetical protein